MDRRHFPDLSRLAPGREATGVYRDEELGKLCRRLTEPEARRECILRAMAQEAEWELDQEKKARQKAALAVAHAAARGQPPPSAVDRANYASVVTTAYENGKRVGEMQGRLDVASNQRAALEALASIATVQEIANSDGFLGDAEQRAAIVRRLRAAIRELQSSYDARGQPPPSAVDRANHASVATTAYENGKRVGEMQGRLDVASNQRAALEALATIATRQEIANSDSFLGDAEQRADIVRRLRAAVRELQSSYDA